MNKILCIVGFIMAITMFSCEKNVQDATYTGKSALFLKGPLTGSALGTSGPYTYSEINFSFSNYPSTKMDTIINLTPQVVGGVVNYDRKFTVVADSLSSVFPDEYEFISDYIIPANSFQGKLGVKIKKSRRLSTASAKLIVRVVETNDFLVNKTVNALSTSNPNTTLVTSFPITWTNQLIKPLLWNGQFGLDNFIGGYTKVKHQLILDLTPYGSTFEIFLTSTDYNNQKYQIQSILQQYVAKYNLEHPGQPLMNEDNVTPVVIARQSIPR
ncbi:DUF4843 domain-containing protein [Pedobacter frigiditerrae]|uniref:DUF4843 domain-containing protein n=1 Tax=Pedobacter frigiditerrae TaxID=2530452 RepID=UPI00292E4654|nr:DUF4843 domain-containing protein [Pedobacter frigiditerrae]